MNASMEEDVEPGLSKQALRALRHREEEDSAYIRSRGSEAARRKIEAEEEEEEERAEQLRERCELDERDLLIAAETLELERTLPDRPSLVVVSDMISVDLADADAPTYRRLSCSLNFPSDYPSSAVIPHLSSGTLAAGLLTKLQTAAEQEAAKHLGGRQCGPVLALLQRYLEQNELCTAFEDVRLIRALLQDHPGCELTSARTKSGELHLLLQEANYHMTVEAHVPHGYPGVRPTLRVTACNLPADHLEAAVLRAEQLAVKCSEPPPLSSGAGEAAARSGAGTRPSARGPALLHSQQVAAELQRRSTENRAAREEQRHAARARFRARPSLADMVRVLLLECLVPLAAGSCPCCEKLLLPRDPSKLGKVPRGMKTIQLYCGHTYHMQCVEGFLGEPPFSDKSCKRCDKPIEHHRLMTNLRVLEERWAADQAHSRELEEVMDIFSL